MPDTATQETVNWSVTSEFQADPNNMKVLTSPGHTRYPKGAKELEIELWNRAAEIKIADLKEKGLELQIKNVRGRKGVKARQNPGESFRMVMYPGTLCRYVDFYDTSLVVEQTLFSEGVALQSPEYRRLFEDADLPVPHGPIAPVLYITTRDGYIAATVRGEDTPKYPGGIWGVGGDLDDPLIGMSMSDSIIGKHLSREAKEELENSEALSTNPIALGIVWDKALRKHDLIVLSSYPAPFSSIKKGNGYLPDVASITEIPIREEELADFLISKHVSTVDPSDQMWVGRPTPPCSAGLYLIGKHLYGREWAEIVLDNIEITDQKEAMKEPQVINS